MLMYSGAGTLRNYAERNNSENRHKAKKNILPSTEMKANEPSLIQTSSNSVPILQLQHVLHPKREPATCPPSKPAKSKLAG